MKITRMIYCVALAGAAIAQAGDEALKNYWQVAGGRMAFAGGELAVAAVLPGGFSSLRVGGHEFLHQGDGYAGITFRKPDGNFVTSFTDIGNLSHDSMHGRNGMVADGVYLVKFITGWTLPEFTIYAGFNDAADHDLVLFLHPDIVAVRMTDKGRPVSMARQIAWPGNKGMLKGNAAAIVHRNGTVLRIDHPLQVGMIKAPDGAERFAVVIPCKGMAANDIVCRYDVNNNEDALLNFPQMTVSSPTMGQGDVGYKPQSHGYWALYEKDAEVTYTINFAWLGKQEFGGKAILEARHALGQPHLRIEAKPKMGAKEEYVSHYTVELKPTFTMPGVSEVNVHLLGSDGTVLHTERVRILYDWESFQPDYNMPADLNAFWDDTLAELAKVPLEPKVEKQLFKDDPEWEFYHVSFNGWQEKRLHACLYVPKNAQKPLPVAITSHPGTLGFGVNNRPDGVYGSRVRADPRFVTIVPLIRGHEPDAKEVPFNQPWWGPLDKRDDYVARAWFTTMVRALDYLATRPDLADMSRVYATGGSQGGALALVTAALDKRVSLCVADCPSNCMHHYAVRPETYGTFGPTSGQVPEGQTLDDLLRTLSYYDPAHLATRITCPTVVHQNVGDLTVHSMGALGVYKNLTGLATDKKWFKPGVSGHFHAGSRGGTAIQDELVEKLLKGEL